MGVDPVSLGLMAVVASTAASVAGTAVSYMGQKKQAKAQAKAAQQAQDAAVQQNALQQQEIKRQQSEQPDVSQILKQNQGASQGAGSTFLTGAGGAGTGTLGGGSKLG